MIHKCWPLGTFLTPFPFRSSLYLFRALLITPSLLLVFPALSSLFLLANSIPSSLLLVFVVHLHRFIYNFRGQDAVLYNRASHWTVSPFLCSQLIHPETGSSWGRPQQNRKWWREGVKERAGRARIAWAFLRGLGCVKNETFVDTNICVWLYHEKQWDSPSSSFPSPHLLHAHGWRWVHRRPGMAGLAESAERGEERQRGEEQEKIINSHWHTTLHQDCYWPEREREEGRRACFSQFDSPWKDKERLTIGKRARGDVCDRE